MDTIRILLRDAEAFDAFLRTPDPDGLRVLPDGADLTVITKGNGTQGGRPIVMLTFTAQLPDGTMARAQTVTTLGNFMTMAAALRASYGDPPYPPGRPT